MALGGGFTAQGHASKEHTASGGGRWCDGHDRHKPAAVVSMLRVNVACSPTCSAARGGESFTSFTESFTAFTALSKALADLLSLAQLLFLLCYTACTSVEVVLQYVT